MAKPRSLRRLAEELGYEPHTLEGWSSDFEWSARVADYDHWLDRRAQRGAAKAAESEGMRRAKRQLKLARLMQDVGKKKLEAIIGKDGRAFDEFSVNANQAARLAKDGVILERLVTGEATERTETKTDYSKLSLEDLQKLDELDRKAKGK